MLYKNERKDKYSTKDNEKELDEIKEYLNYRYISAIKACRCILGFDINFKEPAIEQPTFHLPNEQTILF